MAFLSLTIWVPIAFGIAVLALADDRSPDRARWTALAGSLLGFLVSVPLWTGFQNTRTCSSSSWRRGSRAST
jgi:NADH-quinone oxidoreductase subunit M